MIESLLLHLLDGATHASALMPWGKPGPIRLPDSNDERRALVRAHVNGAPATVCYSPLTKPEQLVKADPLVLSGLCPDASGLARWIAFDLDAADGHGDGGLVDPAYLVRCFAERADVLGLLDGLVAARSKSAAGYHVWLLTPSPVPLDGAVIAAGAFAAAVARVAGNALRCADGSMARPGKAGAFELIPPSTNRVARGWGLTLPGAGAYRDRGGAVVVDPFAGRPVDLQGTPRCDPLAWQTLLNHARYELDRRRRYPLPRQRQRRLRQRQHPLERLDQRTHDLLGGMVPEGGRNAATFAGVCNLVGCGVAPDEAQQLALDGALACGLPGREAKATIRSALRRMEMHG